ncbi:DUF2026 family protein [Variovorax boronicumulans]
MKNASRRAPLWLPDYERIFRTIHGVLLNEQSDGTRACVYFGTIGAAILRSAYGMDARAQVGAAGYGLGAQLTDAFVFGEHVPGGVVSSDNGFHCWIEVDGWAIDFQAPLFRDLIASTGRTNLPQRIMVQKQIAQSVATPADLRKDRFWYAPDADLRRSTLEHHNAKKSSKDFEDICVQWFRRPPHKMMEPIGIADQGGQVKPVFLSPVRVTAAW